MTDFVHFSVFLDNDKPSQCALDSYNDCLRQYDKIYPNLHTCRDSEFFFKCMDDKAETCEAPILQHFAQVINLENADEFSSAKSPLQKFCKIKLGRRGYNI